MTDHNAQAAFYMAQAKLHLELAALEAQRTELMAKLGQKTEAVPAVKEPLVQKAESVPAKKPARYRANEAETRDCRRAILAEVEFRSCSEDTLVEVLADKGFMPSTIRSQAQYLRYTATPRRLAGTAQSKYSLVKI